MLGERIAKPAGQSTTGMLGNSRTVAVLAGTDDQPNIEHGQGRRRLRFERTKDLAIVKEIITHPRIYPHITDDGSPLREEYTPVDHPSILYVLVFDRDETIGLFVFYPESSVSISAHTCLLPAARFPFSDDPDGPGRSVVAARGVIRWVWENSPFLRITTHVPAYNRLALHFAQKAGMLEWGRNPMSWLKHGQLWDQIYLGISKPEVQ